MDSILEETLREYVSHCKGLGNVSQLLLSLLDGVGTAQLETISSLVCAEQPLP